MASGSPTFTKLNEENYSTWSGEMEAWLRASGLWRLVSGRQKAPSTSSPVTQAEADALDAFGARLDKAAGWLYLMVEQEQRIHFQGIQDSPVKMWEALEAEESLQSLINRVESSKQKIKELRPSSFTLEQLDDELASMALIRALPDEFSGFTSSLLLMDKLDKTTVHQAFVTEDLQRRKRAQDASGSSQALAARSGSQFATKTCDFCGREGHKFAECKTFERAKSQAQEDAQKPRTPSTQTPEKAQRVTEFAGNASTPYPSPSPLPSTPLQLDADFHWLADTGATSHMTPHRHWFKSYTSHKIPIRLADNSIVYSLGVGSVVFEPVVNGKVVRAVELTRVLHVLALRSNLLSCLYLARNKGFNITIASHSIDFKCKGTSLFTATIHSNNSAELDGSTLTSETAFSVSTLPVDLSLWHRRFIHHNYADVKSMITVSSWQDAFPSFSLLLES
ncbi:hypothetical protein Agabi119p4_11158 [Agaricus bisporus var. burnettii]|uniref:Retrovirus-related Pol polyprotein from transposon TNT 1-94-like beta-barrel domain-containing protein n=1 Tax=Agaricus bisporus var. burnettii TaxID=192524 RepID=A0A8H7EW13_AGABI|nr:hypothetical protein Agabi119p4_11158 [Agaricus bisporus var. burnettii]